MKKLILLIIIILSLNQAISQNNKYIKTICGFCKGSKKNQYDKNCPNCYYWTESQRQYNYCSVCKNRKYILGPIEKCTYCEGYGYELHFNVDEELKFFENFSDARTSITIIDKNHLVLIPNNKNNPRVDFYSNGSLKMNLGNENNDKIEKLSWYLDEYNNLCIKVLKTDGENFSFKLMEHVPRYKLEQWH